MNSSHAAAWIFACCAIAATMGLNPAQAQTQFETKITPNASYKTKTASKVNQTLTLFGNAAPTKSLTEAEVSTKYGEQDAEGFTTVENSILKLKTELEAPVIGKVSFDSSDESKASGEANILDTFKAAAKSKTTYKVGRDLTVKDVKTEKLSALSPGPSTTEVQAQWKYKNDILPKKAVSKGDSWTASIAFPLGQGQYLNLDGKYTYEGEVNRSTVTSSAKVHKITAVFDKVSISTKEAQYNVKASDLKVTSSSAEFYFDPKSSRIVEDKVSTKIDGSFTMSVMGMDFDAKLDLDMQVANGET